VPLERRFGASLSAEAARQPPQPDDLAQPAEEQPNPARELEHLADGLAAPRGGLVPDVTDLGQAVVHRLELLAAALLDLRLNVVQRLAVRVERSLLLLHPAQRVFGHVLANLDGRLQLLAQPLDVAQRLADVGFDLGEARSVPQNLVAGLLLLCGESIAGRHQPDRRVHPQVQTALLLHEIAHLRALRLIQQVHLVDDDDHPLAICFERLQVFQVAGREHLRGDHDQQHHVGAVQEAARHLVVRAEDRLQPRCIHQAEVLQQRTGVEHGLDIAGARALQVSAAPQDDDVIGRRDRPHIQNRFAEQGVDDARLARAERPDHDHEERVVGVEQGIAHLLHLAGGQVIHPRQRVEQGRDLLVLLAAHRLVLAEQLARQRTSHFHPSPALRGAHRPALRRHSGHQHAGDIIAQDRAADELA